MATVEKRTHAERRTRRIVLSTVSSDSHTWNLVFLQLLMEEHGHEVINLGPCVPDAALLDAVRRHRPDALVISTVNGHGHLDGARAVRGLRDDPAVAHVPAVIGGKLGIRGCGDDAQARALIEAGFDAVFTESDDPEALPAYLAGLEPAVRALIPAGGNEPVPAGENGENAA